MAGSYKHVVTSTGNLRDNDSFVNHIENLGDAYEAVEEMYGMIWFLASTYAGDAARASVQQAQQFYREGIEAARRIHREA